MWALAVRFHFREQRKMVETLIGTLLGGLFRLAPEILKYFTNKSEQKHELEMIDRQNAVELQKLKGKLETYEELKKDSEESSKETIINNNIDLSKLEECVSNIVNKSSNSSSSSNSFGTINYKALSDLTGTNKAEKTGNKYVDIIATTVRPFVTYWLFFIYFMVKVCVIYLILTKTSSLGTSELLKVLWSADDIALLSGIVSFWFVGRAIERKA